MTLTLILTLEKSMTPIDKAILEIIYKQPEKVRKSWLKTSKFKSLVEDIKKLETTAVPIKEDKKLPEKVQLTFYFSD